MAARSGNTSRYQRPHRSDCRRDLRGTDPVFRVDQFGVRCDFRSIDDWVHNPGSFEFDTFIFVTSAQSGNVGVGNGEIDWFQLKRNPEKADERETEKGRDGPFFRRSPNTTPIRMCVLLGK